MWKNGQKIWREKRPEDLTWKSGQKIWREKSVQKIWREKGPEDLTWKIGQKIWREKVSRSSDEKWSGSSVSLLLEMVQILCNYLLENGPYLLWFIIWNLSRTSESHHLDWCLGSKLECVMCCLRSDSGSWCVRSDHLNQSHSGCLHSEHLKRFIMLCGFICCSL